MVITVRLYLQHDLDLIALKKHPNSDFNKWIKRAILAWARDEKIIIPVPEPSATTTALSSTALHIRLSDKEKDVIDKINSLKYGFRNSFIKNIFRTYMEHPFTAPFEQNNIYMIDRKGTSVKKQTPKKDDEYKKISEEVKNAVNKLKSIGFKDISIEDIAKATTGISSEQIKNVIEKEHIVLKEAEISENNNEHTDNISEVRTEETKNPYLSNTVDEVKNDSDEQMQDDSFDLFGAVDKLM